MDELLPVLTSFAGIGFGFGLARYGVKKDREYQEKQTVRERQETAARDFDLVLLEVSGAFPGEATRSGDVNPIVTEAYRRLRTAWARSAVITEESIAGRFYTLDILLFMAKQESSGNPDDLVQILPVGAAAEELHQAVTAFQLREEPEAAKLPEHTAVMKIATEGGSDSMLENVRSYLISHFADEMLGREAKADIG